MNDLYFTGKSKKGLEIKSLSQKVYIIRHEVAEYHQCEALYRRSFLANPSLRSLHQTAGKGMHGYAVMIYSSKGADEMHAKA